jgi:hypothetical protein
VLSSHYSNHYSNKRIQKMPGKRKADTEKSSNINTQRVEKRRKQMTSTELAIDNAKRADAAAIAYRVNKLKKSSEWISADPVQQASMVQQCKDGVNHKRSVISNYSKHYINQF